MQLPQRIGLLGDVHAEDVALETALAHLVELGVETVLCTGDIVNGDGDANRCCELLGAHSVQSVRGNHDRWVVDEPEGLSPQSIAFLRDLPPTREYQSARGPVLLCHGLAENDMSLLKPDYFGYALESNDELQQLLAERRFNIVLAGHSHVRMVRAFDGMIIINPGALDRDYDPSFAVVDFQAESVQFFTVSKRKKIKEAELFSF